MLSYGLALWDVSNLAPIPGFNLFQAGVAEMICTFMLCFVVLNCCTNQDLRWHAAGRWRRHPVGLQRSEGVHADAAWAGFERGYLMEERAAYLKFKCGDDKSSPRSRTALSLARTRVSPALPSLSTSQVMMQASHTRRSRRSLTSTRLQWRPSMVVSWSAA